jgi:hypothetical protein
MIEQSLLMSSLFFCIISIMAANGMVIFPIEKIGIPLYWKNVKWTWFIYRNIKHAEILDKTHLKYKHKIIVFYDSWLFEVYDGDTIEEISNKYSLGGQSNKADYLTWWQKIIGKKIEEWYLVNVA